MANESSSFDDALNRLAGLLGPPAPTTTPTPPPGTGGKPAPGVPPGGGAPATPAIPTPQREEIARQVFYSMGVPLITREQLAQMELGLPGLVDLLKSMQSRPTAKADLERLMGAIKDANGGTERDPAQVSRTVALGELMRTDAFGEGERIIPLIGLGIAAFMASYTVVKNWQR